MLLLLLLLLLSKSVLATVGNVKEAVLVLEARVDLAHGGRGLRYGLINKQKDGLLGRQLDPLAYDPHELSY